MLSLYKYMGLTKLNVLGINYISIYGCSLSGWAGLGQKSQEKQFYCQKWPWNTPTSLSFAFFLPWFFFSPSASWHFLSQTWPTQWGVRHIYIYIFCINRTLLRQQHYHHAVGSLERGHTSVKKKEHKDKRLGSAPCRCPIVLIDAL